MATKTPAQENSGNQGSSPGGPGGRDLVFFYSRLVQSLEEAMGRENMANRLADLRRTVETAPANPTSVTRALRRLGLVNPGQDAEVFFDSFCHEVGKAVTRDGEFVHALFALFCQGDPPDGEYRPICGPNPTCHRCFLTRECQHYNSPRKPAMASMSPAMRLEAGNDAALSDSELLAVLLYGEKATGHEEVVKTFFNRYGRFRAGFRGDAKEYYSIRDMSKPLALRLASVAALHRRLLAERRDAVLRFGSAQDFFDRYAVELRDYRTETAVVILLDQQNGLIRDTYFGQDSPNHTFVFPKELLRSAVREYAVAVALVHNHPSGETQPSTADTDYTRRLKHSCDVLGLKFLDHVIVSENGFFSYSESGLMATL